MSVVWPLGKKEIKLNETDSIILETKTEDGYEWNEVTFKSKDEEISIGSYYTYNYSTSREWMEYNSNYIALLAIYTYGYDASNKTVTKLFDINSRKIVEENEDKLLEIYNQEFKGKRKSLFRK